MQHLHFARKPLRRTDTHFAVTELRQIKDSPPEGDANLRAIIEAIPVPLVLGDEQGNVKYLNNAFALLIGYALDEIPTMTDWLFCACPDEQYRQRIAESWQNNLEKAKRTDGILEPVELDIRCKDGTVRNFMVCSVILNNFSESCLIMLHDITEQKLTKHKFQVAPTAFSSQEGMMITDTNNVIILVNSAFTKITGYTAEEAIDRCPDMLNSGQHDASFYAAMQESIQRTGRWEGEIWNRRKNGEIYPGQLAITAVKNKGSGITNFVITFNDTTLNKMVVGEIENVAFYDPLTYLPNRRSLLDRLQQAITLSNRTGRQGALLFIDIDNFKDINDTHGHAFGDLMLVETANRLQSCIRGGDTIARLGTDEFVVMLENMDDDENAAAAQAKAVGEKIHAAIGRSYIINDHAHYCTVCIGITLFRGTPATMEEMLKRADAALYQAKKAGRSTLRFFDPAIQAAITAKAKLETDLRCAISEQDQFQLYYQAQVDSSGRFIGAESLVRWLHPKRGMVSPGDFIPLAEASGLILPLGHWVLATACQQLAAWAKRPATSHLTLAVNVSPKQFHLPTFVDEVLTLIDYYGVDPTKLKLEITESMMMDNVDDIVAKMVALKSLGISFSMDDFGTGYSSLQYLKRLPLGQLKIDQSFVRDIAANSNVKAIVRTIIAMAQSLNLNVIAEGVETEEQRLILLSKGCATYQGYLFCKPVPIEKFDELRDRSCSLIEELQM